MITTVAKRIEVGYRPENQDFTHNRPLDKYVFGKIRLARREH